MAEYIEREAVRRAVFDAAWLNSQDEDVAYDVLESVPAADVVEVVRCRDCKYYDYGKRFPDMKWCCRLKDKNGETVRYMYADDDFCSYGERKNDAENHCSNN